MLRNPVLAKTERPLLQQHVGAQGRTLSQKAVEAGDVRAKWSLPRAGREVPEAWLVLDAMRHLPIVVGDNEDISYLPAFTYRVGPADAPVQLLSQSPFRPRRRSSPRKVRLSPLGPCSHAVIGERVDGHSFQEPARERSLGITAGTTDPRGAISY